jgi:hypothetical protein
LRDELAAPTLIRLALSLTAWIEDDARLIGDKAMRMHLQRKPE